MPTRAALIAGTWVSGAVLAASGVATALLVLGDHAYPSVHVLSQAQVRDELAAQPGVTVTVAPPARPTVDSPGQTPMPSSAAPSPRSAHPAPQRAAHGFRGGTVFASCSGDKATVTQRIPAQGYWIDRVWPGPSTAAGVRFTSPKLDELVIITCSGGQPAFVSRPEPPGGDEQGGPSRGGGIGGPGRYGRPGVPPRPDGGGFGGPGGTSGGRHGRPGGTGSSQPGSGSGQPGSGQPGTGHSGTVSGGTGTTRGGTGQRGTGTAPGFGTARGVGTVPGPGGGIRHRGTGTAPGGTGHSGTGQHATGAGQHATGTP